MADRTKWVRDVAFAVSIAALYRLVRGKWWGKKGEKRRRSQWLRDLEKTRDD